MPEPIRRADPLRVDMSAYAQKLGIVCDLVEPDHVVYSMAFREDNVTLGDTVHGGAIASLADIAATAAAWSSVDDPARYRGATIDLSLSYVAAARGTRVVADARVAKRGGTVCFVDVDVRDGAGELVGRCKVVYKLSRIESPQEKLTGLFAGKSPAEQQALLADLERSGAGIYRRFAEAESDPAKKRELLDAAAREEANAVTLDRMRKR